MKPVIQAVRGMNDFFPPLTNYWQEVETVLKAVVSSYGYQEIRLPLLEKTELFKRSIGEVTDIVEKEMYTFDDRGGESLTLRPEGTASCVRAGIEKGVFYHQVQRFWYLGPMFRYERPQKGRYRQFHHFGVEAFGFKGPDIDAEMVLMTARLFKMLGLNNLTLQINSLGSLEARNRYKHALVGFLTQYQDDLDDDSKKRLHRNPLRILDSKNLATQVLLKKAPSLQDYLDEDSKAHFKTLCAVLKKAKIQHEINPGLVRGLDYYNKTVFEWVTDELGTQGTVCGGGRYDGLVQQLGGHPTPAVGFSFGLERLIELLLLQKIGLKETQAHIYLILANEHAIPFGLSLIESLRNIFPAWQIISHCGGGSLKTQFKHADKSGAKWALILGEDEAALEKITLKKLRENSDPERVSFSELVEKLNNLS